MSLRVWLPLTKDLRNQGLDDVTVTNNGATFNANGKLGGCYYFNNVYAWLPMDYSTFGTEFSVAFWYKIDTAFSGNRHLVCLCNQYGWTQLKFTCVAISNSTLAFNIGDGSTSARSLSTSQIIGSWQHICFTFNNKIAKVYVNGIQTGTATYPINPDWSGTTKMGIGGAPDGYERATTLSLNDIRIYDHCLSPLEVKQISQGLILHYPLNRNGQGQENLLTKITSEFSNWTNINSDCVTVTSNEYKNVFLLTQGVGGKWENVYSPAISVEANKEYTISCLYKVYDDYNFTSSYGDFGLTVMKAVPTNANPIGNTIARAGFKNVSGGFWKAQATFTPTVTTIYLNMCGGSIVDGQTNKKFDVNYIKLEKGSIPTPWCPNSADELAITMGLNDNVEYDTSGYCNNGTRIGTFNWTSNAPKYNVSTIFNGTNNAIQTPSLPSMISDKNYTIAVWIYKTVIGSKGYQTIYGGPSGFEIEARNGSANETKFVPWNWGKPMASYELNEWNHCVFVHSDSDCKIYLNGEYIATGTAKASNPSGNYFVGAWKTATQQNFEGNMSDFRIYATALSAEDVKSLYQNSAYIDNQGNIYGAVYEEV